MDIAPIGSSGLSSLFAPQPEGRGGLTKLFGPPDEQGGLGQLFGDHSHEPAPLHDLFKSSEPAPDLTAHFQDLALQALNARLQLEDPNASAGVDIFAVPGQDSGVNAGSFFPFGGGASGGSAVGNILGAFFQPQHDLIGQVIDALG